MEITLLVNEKLSYSLLSIKRYDFERVRLAVTFHVDKYSGGVPFDSSQEATPVLTGVSVASSGASG
jgi:hypothetical protein